MPYLMERASILSNHLMAAHLQDSQREALENFSTSLSMR